MRLCLCICTIISDYIKWKLLDFVPINIGIYIICDVKYYYVYVQIRWGGHTLCRQAPAASWSHHSWGYICPSLFLSLSVSLFLSFSLCMYIYAHKQLQPFDFIINEMHFSLSLSLLPSLSLSLYLSLSLSLSPCGQAPASSLSHYRWGYVRVSLPLVLCVSLSGCAVITSSCETVLRQAKTRRMPWLRSLDLLVSAN